MPPRGRPPGRKSLGSRLQNGKSKQPSTPRKPGRISRKSMMEAHQAPSSLLSAPEIHVGESAADAKTKQPASEKGIGAGQMESDVGTAAPNGEQAAIQDSSPDDETASDANSAVMTDAVVPSSTTTAAAAVAPSASPPAPLANGHGLSSSSSQGVGLATAAASGPGQRTSLINGTVNGNGSGYNNSSASRAGRYRETPRASLGAGGGYAAASIDLDAISYRQLNEDVNAYAIDLDFCDSQLVQPDLTPQETRTLQLRRLDLGHQIRFSQHRRELLEAQRLVKGGRPLGRVGGASLGGGGRDNLSTLVSRSRTPYGAGGSGGAPLAAETAAKRPMSVTALLDESASKRVRAVSEASAQDTISVNSGSDSISNAGSNADGSGVDSRAGSIEPGARTMMAVTPVTNITDEADERDATYSLQRLGFWKCRLCTSEKYLMAGAGRQPSAPSKWPLKDMGKLMSHYFDMHTEHEPDERCAELGDALDKNREFFGLFFFTSFLPFAFFVLFVSSNTRLCRRPGYLSLRIKASVLTVPMQRYRLSPVEQGGSQTAAAGGTGSGASSGFVSSGSAAARVPRRPRRGPERSCMLCHRRKVRCDKSLPCGNCSRAGVLCCYPSGDRAARQPKATIADIATRLVQLEKTLVAVSSGSGSSGGSGVGVGDGAGRCVRNARRAGTARAPAGAPPASSELLELPEFTAGDAPSAAALSSLQQLTSTGSQPRTSPSPSTPRAEDDDTGSVVSEEILLKNSCRYINEILLSRILEEEQEIQSMLASLKESEVGDEDREDSLAQGPAPALGLFWSAGNNRLRSETFRPSKAQAIQLWQIYKQNVEPLDKILHVPSTEIQVYTAINGTEKVNPALSCLLFSIYFAAATTCLPEEYKALFGEDKHAALDRFKAGLECSLAQSSFLEAPTVYGLQALTLFLRLSRAHSPGREAWILHGTVLRAAQSIGFHRDGDNFRLSPFEAEMRRRIWWHLFCHDARAAEDHGITIDALDHSCDIKFPLNINDSDMDPDMKELPPPRTGWTDMTLPVCMYRLTQMLRLLHQTTTEARRIEVVREYTACVEELQRNCNPVVPIQRATIMMVRVVQLKYDFVSQLQLVTAATTTSSDGPDGAEIPGGPENQQGQQNRSRSRASHATEESLLGACQIVELSQEIEADELMQNFRWAAEIYPQYHVLLYLLWHLCVRPLGSTGSNGNASASIERAWAAVNDAFDSEIARQQRQRVGGGTARANPKWAVLTALRDKALRIREAVQQKAPGSANNTYSDANLSTGKATVMATPPEQEMASASAPAPALASSAVPPALPDVDMTSLFEDGTDNTNSGWDTDFLDWNVIADDFQADTFDFASSL